jgi:cytochrome c oxidase subunit 3
MGTKHFSVAADVEAPGQIRLGGNGPRDLDPLNFGGDDRSRRWRVPNRTYQTGTWLFIAAVTMMFAGFTSTVVVRQSAGLDWVHTYVPPVLYFNTLILLVSSITFEYARRAAKRTLGATGTAANVLYATLGLGVLFVAGQVFAWRTLALRGVYLASNPSSSTFYLLTAIHALHLMGGVAVLTYLVSRMRVMRAAKFEACLSAASLYWHFMSALWLYILFLLVTRV